MPRGYCEHCRQPLVTGAYNDDLYHECRTGNDAIDKESVTVIGDYIDEQTGELVKRGNIPYQALENTLAGTDADWLGMKLPEKNIFDKNKHTQRLRQKQRYTKFKEMGGVANAIR